MTAPGTTTTNVAADAAHVGVQGTVHGDVYSYTISADPSPEEKFETGVRFLDGGMSGPAWRLISEAFVTGHVTNRSCFYWLLALVSGRTWRELSKEETAMLRDAQNLPLKGNDAWTDAVRTVLRLLDAAQKPGTDLRTLLRQLDQLGGTQYALILLHLELFLDGPLKDEMWHRALTRAEQEQTAGERMDRVWKFFHPKPATPQISQPRPVFIPTTTWIRTLTATAFFVTATGHIGYLLAQEGQPSALLAYLLSITGGYVSSRSGLEWRFRTVRRHAKDKEYLTPDQFKSSAPPGSFAKRVDERFEYYFAKYLPPGMDRASWLATTAGIRKSMRDEIVEAYSGTKTGVDKINWLIRHRASNVRTRWQNGTLWHYRHELATPLRTKAVTIFGLAALMGGGMRAVGEAVAASPLSAATSTVFILAGGWVAARAWLHIILEQRRFAADKIESEQARQDAEAALERWRMKLANKPKDREMAAWLDCDRKLLLSAALQHYRLTMSNVIAHAFIEAPAASTARARVRNGPWRYKKYQLLIFLLTTEGVRQLTVTLDFMRSSFHDWHRLNYRFDAIAAVRVRQKDNDERTLQLTLVNGDEIPVQMTSPGMEELQQGENPGAVSEVTLDASGIYHTLHILEGIAAEGKEWITQENRRGEARRNNLRQMSGKPSVLFVCVHNASRSQMAAAWLAHLAGDAFEIRSAGSAPAKSINPVAVKVMGEVGINITAEKPKALTSEAVQTSDVVITMGCADVCPFFSGKRYEDWQLDDPTGQDIEAVRAIRDDIRARVEKLIAELLPPETDSGFPA